jgi:hypothetical protein
MMNAQQKPATQKPMFNRPQLTEIYNALSGRPVKTFRSQKEAIDKILKAVETKGKVTTRTARPGRKPEYADDDLVESVVKENPKKEGTKAHERFGLYKKGMKVAEYIAAGGNRADLSWDVEHEFIKIRRV